MSVPLAARHVERPSRLISSLPRHVWRAGVAVLQSILGFRSSQVYGSLGILMLTTGLAPFLRFVYFFVRHYFESGRVNVAL